MGIPTSSHVRDGLYRSLRHPVYGRLGVFLHADTRISRVPLSLRCCCLVHLSHFFIKRVHSVAGVLNVARRQWRIEDGQRARGSTRRHRRRRVRHGIVAASMAVLFLTPFLKSIGVAYFRDRVPDIALGWDPRGSLLEKVDSISTSPSYPAVTCLVSLFARGVREIVLVGRWILDFFRILRAWSDSGCTLMRQCRRSSDNLWYFHVKMDLGF